MEEFLGILFAGGRGTRLGLITQYISKAFVPVYDRPVFLYPLAQLQASHYISEIVILTNTENDARLCNLGYRTVIQDDDLVHDMISGLAFIKERISTYRHFVLMPCDNISDLSLDRIIEKFLEDGVDICFNITHVREIDKLKQMGVLDPLSMRVCYKPEQPPSEWGVIAPYVIRNEIAIDSDVENEFINSLKFTYIEHSGYWFDIGDYESIIKSSIFINLLKG